MKMKLLKRGKHLGIYWNIEIVMGLKRDYSMDWFKEKLQEPPHISWENLWFIMVSCRFSLKPIH